MDEISDILARAIGDQAGGSGPKAPTRLPAVSSEGIAAVARHIPKLLSVAARIAGPEAADAVQDALIATCRAGTVDWHNALPYLLVAVEHAARRRAKAARARREVPYPEVEK